LEALELDRTSGTTLWHDAIMKEMTNVRVAFDLKGKGSALPIGHKLFPMRMIFDIIWTSRGRHHDW
jgi:hypothetical protein